MRFIDCIRQGRARKINPSRIRAQNILKSSGEAIKTAQIIPIQNTTKKSIMRELYEGLREYCEAIGFLYGYKFCDHESIVFFLHDELIENTLSRRFDRYRKLRNGINYYGDDIHLDTVKEALQIIPRLIQDLAKHLYKKLLIKTKKLESGFELPVLAIGTWGMGGEREADYSRDKEHIASIKDAISLGYTHIDTAELYGNGHTEELVGRAIKDFDRKNLFITTKVFNTHLDYNSVLTSAKQSIKRLAIDYIDLYLVHAPSPQIPIEETMRAMDYLVDLGLIKNIGVSNFSADEIKEAQKYSKHKIVVNQLKYNFFAKSIDLKTITYCQDNDIMIIAYKPFGREAIKTEKKEMIKKLAEKYQKTEAQVILKWLISKKNTIALFKASQRDHLIENRDIFDFKLEDKELKDIDALVKE